MKFKNCKHKVIEDVSIIGLGVELDKFGEQESIQVIATQVFQTEGVGWSAIVYYKDWGVK